MHGQKYIKFICVVYVSTIDDMSLKYRSVCCTLAFSMYYERLQLIVN